MSAPKTLSTVNDIIEYGPAHQEMDTDLLKPYILIHEEKLFRTCLGFKFYEALLADCVDHSLVQPWSSSAEYTAGDSVSYQEKVYIARKALTAAEAEPRQLYAWSEADKFNTAKYNTLWYRYLRPLIAWFVVYGATINIANRAKNRGILKPTGGEAGIGQSPERPSSHEEVISLKNDFGNTAWDLHAVMHEYIMDKKAEFPLYLPILNPCECKCFGINSSSKVLGFYF